MRFTAEHRFGGSVESVADLLTSADFYSSLRLPDLSSPSVVAQTSDGNHRMLRLRYEFVGNLDPLARRLLGSHRLSWDQEVRVDVSERVGELTFAAVADPRRLHGSAGFDLVADGGGCVRRLAGELIVAVPVIGSRAEARIVPGLVRRLNIEAEALEARLHGD